LHNLVLTEKKLDQKLQRLAEEKRFAHQFNGEKQLIQMQSNVDKELSQVREEYKTLGSELQDLAQQEKPFEKGPSCSRVGKRQSMTNMSASIPGCSSSYNEISSFWTVFGREVGRPKGKENVLRQAYESFKKHGNEEVIILASCILDFAIYLLCVFWQTPSGMGKCGCIGGRCGRCCR
jgi:hypothetical protein